MKSRVAAVIALALFGLSVAVAAQQAQQATPAPVLRVSGPQTATFHMVEYEPETLRMGRPRGER
jgi:hypothetical protein